MYSWCTVRVLAVEAASYRNLAPKEIKTISYDSWLVMESDTTSSWKILHRKLRTIGFMSFQLRLYICKVFSLLLYYTTYACGV